MGHVTWTVWTFLFHIFVFSTPGWLVGCFGFNGPLRQYFSLYRAVHPWWLYVKFGYNWPSGFCGDVKKNTMRVLSQSSKNDLTILYS